MFEYRDVVRSTPPVLNVPFIVYGFFHSIVQRWGHVPLAIYTRRRQSGRSARVSREASRSSGTSAWSSSFASFRRISSYIGGQRSGASGEHRTDIQPPLSDSPSHETETEPPSCGQGSSPSSSSRDVPDRIGRLRRLLKVKESHGDSQDSKLFLSQAGQQQKKVVLHKGALLVSAYIKEQDRFAADGPQDIAASILRGFDQAKQRHHEEQVLTRRMVARLVPKVASPPCVACTLNLLVQPRSRHTADSEPASRAMVIVGCLTAGYPSGHPMTIVPS